MPAPLDLAPVPIVVEELSLKDPGAIGPPGPPGPQGVPGADGRTIWNGAGPPSAGTGVNGDFYIDNTAHAIYGPKAGGAWGAGTNLIGPTGATGATGVAGPTGATGAAGSSVRSGSGAPAAGLGADGDFYINTATWGIYGPKTAGAWGAPTSLVGPQGAAGVPGYPATTGHPLEVLTVPSAPPGAAPAWAPIPAGGASLQYLADWVAGTYQDGDMVVKDGVAWMCAGGPTAVAPDVSLWGTLAPIPPVTIATTFPASPVDQQEVILVDSLTLPTYQWHFKYVASITDANKWIFVGGAPRYSWVSNSEAVTSATYVALGNSPTVVAPRAGAYLIRFGVRMDASGAGALAFFAMKNGAVAITDDDALQQTTPAASIYMQVVGSRSFPVVAAGASFVMNVKSATLTVGTRDKWAELLPVRVA